MIQVKIGLVENIMIRLIRQILTGYHLLHALEVEHGKTKSCFTSYLFFSFRSSHGRTNYGRITNFYDLLFK
jgi:hypothetical protein